MLECQKEGAHIKKSTLKQVLGKKLFFVFFEAPFLFNNRYLCHAYRLSPSYQASPTIFDKGKALP